MENVKTKILIFAFREASRAHERKLKAKYDVPRFGWDAIKRRARDPLSDRLGLGLFAFGGAILAANGSGILRGVQIDETALALGGLAAVIAVTLWAFATLVMLRVPDEAIHDFPTQNAFVDSYLKMHKETPDQYKDPEKTRGKYLKKWDKILYSHRLLRMLSWAALAISQYATLAALIIFCYGLRGVLPFLFA